MRRSVSTGVLLFAMAIFWPIASASATENIKVADAQNTSVSKLLSIETDNAVSVIVTEIKKDNGQDQEKNKYIKDQTKTEEKHVVTENENLSKIADQYKVTWQRLFFKNESIKDPNIISAGVELVIPKPDEQLVEREIPSPPAVTTPVPVVVNRQQVASPTAVAQAVPTARYESSDNRYEYGYCTWYVKNRRPDMPNNLGNAATWVAYAAAQGMATGSVPRAGAVGQRGNHVVYVESVNGDGTILISEMNREGWNVQSSRTVSAAEFSYIY